EFILVVLLSVTRITSLNTPLRSIRQLPQSQNASSSSMPPGSIPWPAYENRSKRNLGRKLAKGYLHRLLKNPFYGGFFVWEGKKYPGTQAIFVDPAIFQGTHEILNNSHRPKLQRHEFAFSGLLTCAFDHCAVTAEIKKGRYVYYHCTGYRGKCALPYMREEAVGEQLGQILKNIHIPDEVLRPLQDSLVQDSEQVRQERAAQRIRLEQRLSAVRR